MQRIRPAAVVTAAVLTAAAVLTGCSGGGGTDERPGAAEPADSPPVDVDPAGTVVDLAPDPEGMVFDERTGLLAVAVREPTRLLLIDGGTGEVRREVPIPGHARHLQLAAPGGPVLVPAEDSDTYVEVSLPDGEVDETSVGRYPHDAATVDSGQTLVADELGGTLSVVEDGEVEQTFDSQTQPGGVAAVGDIAGVVDVADFTITTYDVAAGKRIAVADAGSGPTHLVADADGRFLVADTRGGAVLVFRAVPLTLDQRYELPGTPYGVAYDEAAGMLWVTLTARNEVVGLSTGGDSLAEVYRFPTVEQPNTVAVDPASGRVYLTSRDTGELQIIEP